MILDENDFFRQATIRICSSLDIKKAMHLCLRYIENHIPISWMSLNLYKQGHGVMLNLETVTRAGSLTPHPPVALTKKAINQLECEFAEWQDVKIVNNPEDDEVTKTLFQRTGKENISLLVMRLVIEGKRLGALALIAEEKNCYNDTHAELLGMLREPFNIAVSNSLRYMEAVELKDMLNAENQELNKELLHLSGDKIIGADSGLKGVMEMVHQVAPLNSPVMLLGETGVGKEVISNAIHFQSPRKKGPFIKVNCGAIPDTLVDSELFGHEKGAFTGAVSQKRGYFERAQGGSIFLDEIGELPLFAQVKLLRVLQHKEINRVGGTNSLRVDVRIITATHQHLEKMIKIGRFREDLWFRLNIFPITIPPLRHRREDIPALFHHFIQRKSKELKIHTPPPTTPKVIEQLQQYTWPGNVRELENLVERALIRSRGRHENSALEFEFWDQVEGADEVQSLYEPSRKLISLDKVIYQHIQKALHVTNGRIFGTDGAAELLEINPNTLRSKMRKLKIPFKKK